LNLGHLKKQSKELLRACRDADAPALARIRESLPAAAGRDDAAIAAMDLRLHDAQSCIAREYGFASWTQLKDYVETQAIAVDRIALLGRWKLWTFGAGYDGAKPHLAARLLNEHPGLAAGDPALACATGDVDAVRRKIADDPSWARTHGSATTMSPLLCACFSGLLRLPEFASRIRDCAALLLHAGADPNDTTFDPAFPGDPLGALYGAAGRNHDGELTRMLLAAGANPNDGESLYHATESADPECVRLLLEAGARVGGSNALNRSLDFERPEMLRLLLAHGGDPNERTNDAPLTHAIRRRRSPQIVRMLLDAGADPDSRNPQGIGAYRLALRMGLTEIANLLRDAGASGIGDASEGDASENFIAACARGDRVAATTLLAQRPGLIGELDASQLRLLPDLAAIGNDDAARLMVELGWPIAVRSGDIDGSALNHAVFRGDAPLTAFLLAHGAHYDERHGYNDNVYGTLSFASRNHINETGDWLGCAKALIEAGSPVPDAHYVFDDDVEAYFEELRKTD
jgi:ankyrin repeat protein